MASDFYLKIEGIDGESASKGYPKWIEVMTFDHGAMQNVSVQRGADVAGRGQFIPFKFMHAVDKATPKLQQYCMNGQKITKVSFAYCRAIAGLQVPVYEITMENVKIARAEVKTTEANGAMQPVEEVELIAGKMSWKVTPIKPDNTKDGAIEAAFDQIANA